MIAETSVQRSFTRAVFALDSRLRVRNGVFDFCDSPECILRAKIDRAGRRIVLADGLRLDSDDPIVELHYRTENLPSFDANGATVAWARQVCERMENPAAAHAGLLVGLRPPVFISRKRLQDRYRQTRST